MKVKGKNPHTGDEYQVIINDVDRGFIDSMLTFEMTENKVQQVIGNLNVSADIKQLLYSFSKATIAIGENILNIGRKIIDFICKVFTEYPSASFGMIFGAIAGALIGSIPILGLILGPIFTPIAIALGLVNGVYHDYQDKALERKIIEINTKFSPLEN